MNTSESRLQITDRPLIFWIIGGGVVIAGLFVWLTQPGQWLPATFMLGFGLLFMLVPGGPSTVIVDRNTQYVTMRRSSLFSRDVREIPFADILSAEVDMSYGSSRSSSSGPTYRVSLALKNGEGLPLRSYYSSGRGSQQKIADRINTMLGTQQQGPRSLGEAIGQSLAKAVQIAAAQGPAPLQGTTNGVPWGMRVNKMAPPSASTSWHTESARSANDFVMLIQSAGGEKWASATTGLLKGVFSQTYKMYMVTFQIPENHAPGLQQAAPAQGIDLRLASQFMVVTSNDNLSQQFFNPFVVNLLLGWGQKHPAKGFQMIHAGDYGPLFLLYGPGGLYLGFFNALEDPGCQAEIQTLGADLARAAGNL